MTSKDAPTDDTRMQTQLQKLGMRFVERCVGEIVLMRKHLEDARAGDVATFQLLQQLAHRMHGTGAIFGFAVVSDSAGEIELLAERCAGAGTTADTATVEQLLSCFAQLEHELSRLTSTFAKQ